MMRILTLTAVLLCLPIMGGVTYGQVDPDSIVQSGDEAVSQTEGGPESEGQPPEEQSSGEQTSDTSEKQEAEEQQVEEKPRAGQGRELPTYNPERLVPDRLPADSSTEAPQETARTDPASKKQKGRARNVQENMQERTGQRRTEEPSDRWISRKRDSSQRGGEQDTIRGRIELSPDQMPASARDTISNLNVRGADLRDVLRGIAKQHDVNVIVDNAIRQRVTFRLSEVPVIDALKFLSRENGLSLIQKGAIFHVEKPPPPKRPPPPPPKVSYGGNGLTVELQDDSLRRVVRAVAEASGKNIIVQRGLDGTLSGYLEGVEVEKGFATLLENNGYLLRKRSGTYVVERRLKNERGEERSSRGSVPGGGTLWVQADDGKVDMRAREVQISRILRKVASQMELSLVTYKVPNGRISAVVQDKTVPQTLNLLFQGTSYTYRREGGTYYIGNKEASGIETSRLIEVKSMRAKTIKSLLPKSLTRKVTVELVPEHNGMMVTGTQNQIDRVQSAINALDSPAPLILIEAIVVDFRTTDRFELGFEFGQDQERANEARQQGYSFGDDGFEVQGDGEQVERNLSDLIPSGFGIQNIGQLPQDFFAQLTALSQEGKVDIRSRPQISTLNGHSASISVGQTQYFILREQTPIQGQGGDVVVQETERFRKIEANVSLEVTPWVSSSGEVTAKIRPELSTPVGNFNSETPPQINSRVLESTVRLSEGETIVLGGLIRDERRANYNKVPGLGDIPWIGRLFGGRRKNEEKSELVIYLTPRVFYGGKNEAERWKKYRENLDLQDPNGRRGDD